jgi:HAMP domain-containing protein
VRAQSPDPKTATASPKPNPRDPVSRGVALGKRFTLLLVLVFLGGMVFGGAALFQALERRAQDEVVSQGTLLMQTMNSVRSYTSGHVNPLLALALETQPQFIPESVPAFSAREVFEGLRRNPQYADYLYTEATLNPTNPRDRADDFERAIVERFRAQRGLTDQSGYRTWNGQEVFYTARPLVVSSQSCLQCHSDPATAPKSLIATYGSSGGFGWKANETVAAQIIYVPASEVLDSARGSLVRVLAIFGGVFALAIVLINMLLRRWVVRPIGKMALLAERVSAGAGEAGADAVGVEILARVAARSDELGASARAFQQMAQEVFAREQSLRQQVQELRIEVDQAKKASQVAEITDTDYFRDLQKRARMMRSTSKQGVTS